MTYMNRDRYLKLKQQLVCLEMINLKVSLAFGPENTTVERSALITSISDTLIAIEQDYTVPYALLRDVKIGYDLKDMINSIRQMTRQNDRDSDCWEWIPQSMDTERLKKVIFEFPVFNIITNLSVDAEKSGEWFSNTRKKTGELIEVIDLGFKAIRQWLEGEYEIPFGQLLVLINMIELADWYCEFANDRYITEETPNAGQ